MATDSERELFITAILGAVGRQYMNIRSTQEITGFLAMAGHSYNGGLMVIGRAVNGWASGISPHLLSQPQNAVRYAKLVQESVNGHSGCPMQWISTNWNNSGSYSSKRSAFWRCARRVVHSLDIADVLTSRWPSYLVWSNLYKISPAQGGNPSTKLCEIQFPGCCELLNLEILTYNPARILFLTGYGWAAPFIEKHPVSKINGYKYVTHSALVYGARCIIAEHPQGKPEEQWSLEVQRAFDYQ